MAEIEAKYRSRRRLIDTFVILSMFGYKYENPDNQTANYICQVSEVSYLTFGASKQGSFKSSALMAKLRKLRRLFTSFVDQAWLSKRSNWARTLLRWLSRVLYLVCYSMLARLCLLMDFTAQHSLPSPDGALIATLQQSSLAISLHTSEPFRTILLPPEFVTRCRFIRWSRWGGIPEEAIEQQGDDKKQSRCNRILLADDDTVRLYDVNDPIWCALIERAASSLGRIADVVFGYNPNEFLVFSDFGMKLTIWSLTTSRGVEIRDPKYTMPCYSFRPRSGHMAILTRPAAQDILMLLSPSKHELITSVELPTVDAQEVSWSSDGCWLAIRDAASSGHKVLIYTADGQLFKTYSGVVDDVSIGLGLKRMAWNPSNSGLLLGDYSDNVTILSKDTVIITWPNEPCFTTNSK